MSRLRNSRSRPQSVPDKVLPFPYPDPNLTSEQRKLARDLACKLADDVDFAAKRMYMLLRTEHPSIRALVMVHALGVMVGSAVGAVKDIPPACKTPTEAFERVVAMMMFSYHTNVEL